MIRTHCAGLSYDSGIGIIPAGQAPNFPVLYAPCEIVNDATNFCGCNLHIIATLPPNHLVDYALYYWSGTGGWNVVVAMQKTTTVHDCCRYSQLEQ
jgi:hypothetical protein